MDKLNLKASDLVLEIGSGHSPHYRADILCDRWLFSNKQRSNFSLQIDRPLVICKGEMLPFGANAFDFVITRQALEHSLRPAKFLSEIERVGKKGLIICPHAIREEIFGWKNHHWWITQENGQLFLSPKTSRKSNNYYHRLYEKRKAFRSFCRHIELELNIHFFWSAKIKFKINAKTDDLFRQRTKKQAEQLLRKFQKEKITDSVFMDCEFFNRVCNKISKEFRQTTWQIRNVLNRELNLIKLQDLLVCPICHQPLEITTAEIICYKCKENYPVIKGIPILLIKNERKRGF